MGPTVPSRVRCIYRKGRSNTPPVCPPLSTALQEPRELRVGMGRQTEHNLVLTFQHTSIALARTCTTQHCSRYLQLTSSNKTGHARALLRVQPNTLTQRKKKYVKTGLNNDHDHGGVRTLGIAISIRFGYRLRCCVKETFTYLPEYWYGTYELHSNHKDRLESESPAAMYEQVLERGP